MDASPSPPQLPPILPGRAMRTIPQIPDHDIVRQIGSGAYGEVWLAKSLTGAWRAVKIVWRADFDDDRTFNREFEGIEHYEPIARNHPGLVHILHVGRKEEPEQLYYYVMELGDDAQNGVHINPAEYIPRTLQTDKRLAAGKPLPLDYCLEVGSQLSHALIYLHSKNLTHRDIKPANVIFVNGRPKLADIGLVALKDQRSFVGTEGFIPPDGPGSRRADVYALAKVLYEISSGKDRLDFPELPDILPSDTPRKKWIHFNNIICAAAEPRLDHCTILTAEDLAEAIDSLRGYAVHPKFKRPKKKRPMKGTTRVLLAAAAGGGISLLAMMYLFDNGFIGNVPKERRNTADNASGKIAGNPRPSVIPRNGYLFISSTPSGASIYDASGNYVDETPYGPLPLKAGQHVSFTIKKEGYADWKENGAIPAGDTLSLGGELKPYNPPKEGESWIDASGMAYIPRGGAHESELPLTSACFKEFLKSGNNDPAPLYRFVSDTSRKNSPEIVMTTEEGIAAYLSWLTAQCEHAGIIGKEYTISASEIPGFSTDDNRLKPYRLSVTKMQQVSISIRTNPPGASVFLNNVLIGRTPLENYSVSRAPYSIDIKLPGYASLSRSGLDPQHLDLSLQLEKDQSVIFTQPWVNSLGMEFIPLKNNILAQTHETRVIDFERFLNSTKEKQPLKPDFEQTDDHPVVNISRQDAQLFAQWLTDKERIGHLIEKNDFYRLPTDEEWSLMVGEEEDPSQSVYNRALNAAECPKSYFWGTTWPPKEMTGNFADITAVEHLPSSRIIVDYKDGRPYTSPVKSYAPNSKGFFDLDGNVQEWTSDIFGGTKRFKFRKDSVVRGGSYISFRPNQLERSARTPMKEDDYSPAVGFRLVLVRQPPNNTTEKSRKR